jgi:cytochrome c peroxidase
MFPNHLVKKASVVSVAVLAAALFAPLGQTQADVAMPNPPEFPFENPMLVDQDTLGKFLFWDEQMSSDNTVACGTCHIHEAGGSDPRSILGTNPNPGPDGVQFTADDIFGSPGVVHMDANHDYVAGDVHFPQPRVTGRKTPSSINAVYNNLNFWDGRALDAFTDPQTGLVEIGYLGALESQAVGPPNSDVEMAREGRDWDDITDKLALVKPMALGTNLPTDMADFLATYPTYPEMFTQVYGDPAITSKRVAFAIANYERTLISDETPLDAFLKGEAVDLGPFEAGFQLFKGDAFCTSCHVLPFTANDGFHNIGVRPDAEDIGREAITLDPADTAKFKTPNLRNAKLRVPLFHNGGKNSIEEVVDFYDIGGDFPGINLDPDLLVLNLAPQDRLDLIAFVEDGLLDPRVENGLFPFTRPTLASELPSANSVYGVASLSGVGVPPDLLAHVPANQGHPNWLLGVYNATPAAGAVVALSFGSDDGSPFPDPRFPIPMNVDVTSLISIIPATTDGVGTGTVKLSIPINPVLSGMKIYAQWFITDAAAVATGGFYGSEGVEVELL